MNTECVIVCVDDEQIVLNSLKSQIENMFSNVNIEIAESAKEGLEIIEDMSEDDEKIAILISDQIMPDVKGDTFLVDIHNKYPQIVKIMLTGQAGLDPVINSLNNADLFRYIEKPWSPDKLKYVLQEAFDEYHKNQSINRIKD